MSRLEILTRLLGLGVRGPVEDDEAPGTHDDWTPAVDVEEWPREYLVKAELPDMRRDEIVVEVRGAVLELRGERHRCASVSLFVRHLERHYGEFHRYLRLPEDVDRERIAADLADGVLSVHLPKRTPARKTRAKRAKPANPAHSR